MPDQQEPKTKEKRVLYNLTLHKQHHLDRYLKDWKIEIEPRLVPIKNPQDWTQIKRVVKMATMDIPHGSAVLIGGMTQIAILIAQLQAFELFYVRLSFDSGRDVPTGICPHVGWTQGEISSWKTFQEGREGAGV